MNMLNMLPSWRVRLFPPLCRREEGGVDHHGGRREVTPVVWLLTLGLVACVTVNVYFPAPEVDAVAERMVKEIWDGMGPSGPAATPGAEPAHKGAEGGERPVEEPAPQSRWSPGRWVTVWLDRVTQPAYAGANLNVSTAAIRHLQKRLNTRAVEQLKPYLYKGVVGINQQGDMAIRDSGGVAMQDLATVRRLVRADNQDREALYQAIAKANNHPEWAQEIRSRFALKWHAQAKKGWWVQKRGGGWQKK